MTADTVKFGKILKLILEEHNLSGNALAKASGISEGSVRKLMRLGTGTEDVTIQVEILAAVCRTLSLDLIEAMRLVYGIDAQAGTSHYSLEALSMAYVYDQLTEDAQKMLRNTVNMLAKEQGIRSPSKQVLDILKAVEKLQEAHPVLTNRRYELIGKLGRFLGRLTPEMTYNAMIRLLLSDLKLLYPDNSDLIPKDEAMLLNIIDHPLNNIALNALLPENGFRNSLERLSWLFNLTTHPSKDVENMSPEEVAALRALWEFVVENRYSNSKETLEETHSE